MCILTIHAALLGVIQKYNLGNLHKSLTRSGRNVLLVPLNETDFLHN